jgi:hypothetical protein
MSPEDFKMLVDALQYGGPWTIVAGGAYIVRYLYQARERDRERNDEEKQRLNDRIIGMAEKQNDIFDRAELTQKLLLEALKKGNGN